MSLNAQLRQAVVDNDIEKAQALLKKRVTSRVGLRFAHEQPDVNYRSPPDGESLIELAIDAGNTEMVALLHAAGAKVETEYQEKFEALNGGTVLNTTGMEDMSPVQREAVAHETNDAFRKLVASSSGKYVLGDVTEAGIYTLKDATTGEDVVKPTQTPDGNLSYNIANPVQNPEALKALAESKPGKWEIKSAATIEQIRVCIAQMGGNENLVFNDSDPGIKAIKDKIDSEFVVLYKSEMATHKLAGGLKYSTM